MAMQEKYRDHNFNSPTKHGSAIYFPKKTKSYYKHRKNRLLRRGKRGRK